MANTKSLHDKKHNRIKLLETQNIAYKFKTEVQNFWIYIDANQSNFEKTRRFAKQLGTRSPQRA